MKRLACFLACTVTLSACYVRIQSGGGSSGGSYIARGVGFNPSELQGSAKRSTRYALDISSGEELQLVAPTGGIRVVTTDEEPRLEVAIEVRARSQKEARKIVDAFGCAIRRTGKRVKVTLDKASQELRHRSGSITLIPTLETVAYVPRDVTLNLTTESGSVEVTGPVGKTRAHTKFGKIKVRDVQGGCDARSASGSITVQDASGGKVHVRSEFGKLELARVDATEIDLRTNSGSIELRELDGKITARTSFGKIDARKLRGTASLRTESGSIIARGIRAPLEAHTNFGRVAIDGRSPKIHASSSSGSVRAECTGSAAKLDSIDLSSDWGAVTFVAPSDLAAAVSCSTDFGSVKSDFAVLQTNSRTNKKLQGQIGDGRATLRMHSASGSVKILRR